MPKAWEPNTFWEYDGQYATVGEHLCRGYCLFFHCHCRPQPTFELTSLHRVSFQPAIMWWKDCRVLHKTFVLMKNIVSHFFTFSNWKFLTEKTISTQIHVLIQTLLENFYLIVRTLYHNLRLVVILIIYRVVFLTGPPNFQYQNEKRWAANQRFCSMKFSMYKRSSLVEKCFSF